MRRLFSELVQELSGKSEDADQDSMICRSAKEVLAIAD